MLERYRLGTKCRRSGDIANQAAACGLHFHVSEVQEAQLRLPLYLIPTPGHEYNLILWKIFAVDRPSASRTQAAAGVVIRFVSIGGEIWILRDANRAQSAVGGRRIGSTVFASAKQP